MANLARADMISLVLERIGVKAAGQSARAEDSEVCGKAVDSSYARLRKEGLVPFEISAVPEWAQTPLADIVGEDLVLPFGLSMERAAKLQERASVGRRELAKQVAGYRHPIPIRAVYY